MNAFESGRALPNEAFTNESTTSPELVIASIHVEGKGYLCKVTPSSEVGGPLIVTPIADVITPNPNMNDFYYAEKLVDSEVLSQIVPGFSAPDVVPVLNKKTTVADLKTAVFDINLDEAAVTTLENNPSFVFVPDALVSSDRVSTVDAHGVPVLDNLTVGGKKREVFIHPDCGLVERDPQIEFTLSPEADQKLLRRAATKVLETIEGLDNASDRLSLAHIRGLRGIVDDAELMDALETAFIKERLVTIGLQHIVGTGLEAGLITGVSNDNASLTLVALGGMITNEIGGKVIENFMAEEPFGKLLNRVLTKVGKDYELSKSGIEGLENMSDFAHDASSMLSDPDALKSRKGEKWASVVVNSAVLVANQQVPAAVYYGVAGVAINVFGDKYKKYLAQLEKDNPSDARLAEEKTWQDKNKLRIIGHSAKAAAMYAGNIGASAFGASGKSVELAVHLASFAALHPADQLSRSDDAVQRERLVATITELIGWASTDASTLSTEDQYQQYARQKLVELSRERPKPLTLPDTDPLTKEKHGTFTHFPREVGSQLVEGVSQKRYRALDRALDARHGKPEKDAVSQLTPAKAALFVDIHTEITGEKTLLRGATLLAESGKVIELGGEVGSRVLMTLAEQQRNTQGTTYIRTGHGDVNVHLDADRSEISYYDCDVATDHVFFEDTSPADVLEKVKASGMFSEAEIAQYEASVKKGKKITGLSRASKKKMALLEGLSKDETVSILNYPFQGLSPMDEVLAAKYMANVAQKKVVIIRGEVGNHEYKDYLASTGQLDSYEIRGRKIEKAQPSVEEIVYSLNQLDDEHMTGWSTSLKQRFASELIRGYASLVKHDGEYMRQVPVARAQMFTTNPQTGERFKISQVQKVETHMNDDGVAQRTRFDRRGEPYSLYRSLRNNNPEEALRARLREMGINPGAVKFQEFTSSVGVKESDTYTGMKTEYDYSDTTIEIPFDQLRDPNDIYAAHESGGVTDFELVKIEK